MLTGAPPNFPPQNAVLETHSSYIAECYLVEPAIIVATVQAATAAMLGVVRTNTGGPANVGGLPMGLGVPENQFAGSDAQMDFLQNPQLVLTQGVCNLLVATAWILCIVPHDSLYLPTQ